MAAAAPPRRTNHCRAAIHFTATSLRGGGDAAGGRAGGEAAGGRAGGVSWVCGGYGGDAPGGDYTPDLVVLDAPGAPTQTLVTKSSASGW